MKASVETQPPSMHALLYFTSLGSYVEVLNAPAGFEDYVGKICLWTMTNDLVPLESPRNARHLGNDESNNCQVRRLSPGEKMTIVIRSE